MRIPTILLALVLLVPAALLAEPQARLVVQQNNQALVNETRSLSVPRGTSTMVLPDLPPALLPQTLQVRSKTAPQDLHILDIALDDELLSPQSMLRRHLGKKVQLVLPDGKSRDGRVQKEATVLSLQDGALFQVDGHVYSGPYDAILYPALPEGLGPRPRLSMRVDNAGPERQDMVLTYLVRDMNWSMDYVLTLGKSQDRASLSGWASIQNRSGRDFPDAELELLAGEPRSVTPARGRAVFAAPAMDMAKAYAPEPESQELFEYQLYKIKRKVSLANQQSRQVRLFEAASLPVERKLVGRWSALPGGADAGPMQQKLDVVVAFRNTEALGLGLPLPRGVLRAFSDDGEARRFVGEAPLERTAVGSGAELRLGQAFDLSVERVTAEYEKTGKNSYRAAWTLRLKNAKKESQRVVLQEQLPGKWRIDSASHKWTRPSAGMAEFVVDVPPSRDGEPLTLKYSFSTDL